MSDSESSDSGSDYEPPMASLMDILRSSSTLGASLGAAHAAALSEANSANGNGGGSNEEGSPMQRFQTLQKKWEDERSQNNFNPTPILEEMCDILEKETDVYWCHDPDPFEDRHPSRVDQSCTLGLLLKLFFKKENLVQDLFNSYLRESFFSRQGQDTDSKPLNSAAIRLILDILPGLEQHVLLSTPGLIEKLYSWAEKSPEPIQSYATGVLAAALEVVELSSDTEYKEANTRLFGIMIRRLRELQKSFLKDKIPSTGFKRPFAIFASGNSSHLSESPAKSPRRSSKDANKEAHDNDSGLNSPDRSSRPISPGVSSSIGDHSNSSWAEMEPQIIGHFPIHPLSLQAKQIFILRFLSPLAEYQEYLSIIFDEDLAGLLIPYIRIRETKDSRLGFEALKVLANALCHKKFVMEWIGTHKGIQILLNVPRPSIAATAVCQCLHAIAGDDDVMEKVCYLPYPVVTSLIQFLLWSIECSHVSGKELSLMIFGQASAFPILLEIIDHQDGLRRLYNAISLLRILQSDSENVLLTEDEEFVQRQALRHAMVAMKRYFEAHLGVKSEQLKRLHNRDSKASPHPVASVYKPLRYNWHQMSEHVDTLMELMPFRSRWHPVDKLVQLGGIQTLLQIIAHAYDWTFTGRAEMVRCALDVLFITSVVPKVQLSFCDRIELHDSTKTVGMNIILGAAEGDIVQDSADVRRSALLVLINCVSAPISRPGSLTKYLTNYQASAKKKPPGKSSEELINKLWDCVRSNNGIMILLDLLHIKSPITDADMLRMLACKALVGLARSEPAKQIMSKLTIFTSGQFQQLVREPILQDKRAEHLKFQQYAHELFKTVTVGEDSSRNFPGANDLSLERLHRASVVAQTKISFPKKQLLKLIQDYLMSQGLNESASVLQKEANLALMMTPNNKLLMHRSSNHLSVTTTPSTPVRSNSVNQVSRSLLSSVQSTSSQPRPSTSAGHNRSVSSPVMPNTLEASASPAANQPLQLRVHKPPRCQGTPCGATSVSSDVLASPFSNPLPSTGSYTPIMKIADPKGAGVDPDLAISEEQNNVTLVSIVCDYLSSQHSLCQNPMTTCPEFDLLIPHKCPDPRPKNSAPWNFCSRLTRRTIDSPFGGPEGRKLDRKFLYSRFRPTKTFRFQYEQETPENTFTSCAFMPDDSFLLAGTYVGDVKLFNLSTGQEETTYNCHESTIYHLQPSRDCKLLLTSSLWRTPYSCLWSLGEFFETKLSFQDEEYVEFSKLTQDKVIGTKNETATIYDINTGQSILTLKALISNNYSRNRATFDPTDELVLNDGVIFDTRTGKQIRKLDKLNQHLNGVFHPNGLEIVSNAEVWDLRTFQLLKTVPGLDQCNVVFNNAGDVIYAVSLETEEEDGEKYESSFKTFDSSDYSNIATIETRRGIFNLASSRYDQMLAIVENSVSPSVIREESVVRLYDVGRLRAEEDECGMDAPDAVEEDEEDDNGPDEDDSDGEFEDLLDLDSTGDEEDYEDNEEEENEDEEDGNENQGDNSDGDNGEGGNDDDNNDAANNRDDNEEGGSDDGSWEDVESEIIIG